MTSLERIIEDCEKARLRVSPHHIVKLVAVSKNVDSEAVESLYHQGQRAFGENRVQDLNSKSLSLHDLPLEWHFIGRLQTNKINHLLDLNPFLIHSIDSFETAWAIQQRASVKNLTVNALMQINAAQELSKAGVEPQKALETYAKIVELCPALNLKGVMSIGAHSDEENLVTKSFVETRKIFDELHSYQPTICSMGMSGDFVHAIECGSTMVRIGSALFV